MGMMITSDDLKRQREAKPPEHVEAVWPSQMVAGDTVVGRKSLEEYAILEVLDRSGNDAVLKVRAPNGEEFTWNTMMMLFGCGVLWRKKRCDTATSPSQ